MESFPLPPRTVGMFPGWSVLSSGVHTSEDSRYEQRMWCSSVGLTDRFLTGESAVELLLESLTVTEGDRGRCRRAGNVRDDTHKHTQLTHSDHDSQWPCGCSTPPLSFKCVIRMPLRAARYTGAPAVVAYSFMTFSPTHRGEARS